MHRIFGCPTCHHQRSSHQSPRLLNRAKYYNRSVSRCKYSILYCIFFVLDAQKLNILRETVCFLNPVTTDILGQAGKNEVYLQLKNSGDRCALGNRI